MGIGGIETCLNFGVNMKTHGEEFGNLRSVCVDQLLYFSLSKIGGLSHSGGG